MRELRAGHLLAGFKVRRLSLGFDSEFEARYGAVKGVCAGAGALLASCTMHMDAVSIPRPVHVLSYQGEWKKAGINP